MKWEFTPDEFLHVWAETGLDRYPSPLLLRSSVQWEDDFATLAHELAARLPRGGDPDLTAVLRAAACPDSTLTLTGVPDRPIRAYGAITGTLAVSLAQRTTADPIYGGNVVIQAGRPPMIPKIFAALAGSVPPGKHGPLVESTDRMRLEHESWVGTGETTATRIRRLFASPRSGAGAVEIRHRLRTERPHPPRHLTWIDVAGDGRYEYRIQHNDFHVIPRDRAALEREIAILAYDEPDDHYL